MRRGCHWSNGLVLGVLEGKENILREFSISPYENPTWNIDNPITKAEIKASIEDDSYKLGNEPNWREYLTFAV